MMLRAIVPNSTFDDVLADLESKELNRILRGVAEGGARGVDIFTASGSVDRLLELAKKTGATPDKDFLGNLDSSDQLTIDCLPTVQEYKYETQTAQLCFWSNDFNERL